MCTAAVAFFGAWNPDVKPNFKESPLTAVMYEYRMKLLVLSALSSAALTVAAGWTGRRKKSIDYFLEHLHKRSWSKSGGKDLTYRVAFFIERPWKRGRLTCYARTDRRESNKAWSMTPPADRDADGVVGYVWQTGMVYPVKGLPAAPTQAQVADYLKQTYITKETYDSLSWKGCAMLGVPVQLSPDGPIGVLLVECKTHDSEVNISEFSRDAEVAGMIWEGRL